MKIASLQNKKPLASMAAVFTRVSDTEGQIHSFDGDGWNTSNVYSVHGTVLELNAIEEHYKLITAIHLGEQLKTNTVSSEFVTADTVMVESQPASEIRPAAAKNALGARNKGLIKRLA